MSTPAPSTPRRRSVRRRAPGVAGSTATPRTPSRARFTSPRRPPRTTPRKRPSGVPHTPITQSRKRRKSTLRAASPVVDKPGEGRVQVMVRVRPLSEGEGTRSAVTNDEHTCTLAITNSFTKAFTFDRIFGTESTQAQVFDSVGRQVVDGVLHGFSGTIFAYGQTGSGKTYTMQGECDIGSEERGLTPRAIEFLFTRLEKLKAEGWEYTVKCSFVEIYNETITDLLDSPGNTKQLRECAKRGVFVNELVEVPVTDPTAALKKVESGLKARHIACTRMNHQSSRAHAVFTLTVEGQRKGMFGDTLHRSGKLNLIDLAGSERQRDTGATGARLKEAAAINKSLSALGNVIKAVVSRQTGAASETHVNYRDSKLTFLLKHALGGNCRTCIIANVNPMPRFVAETMSTMQFASRAKMIRNRAQASTSLGGNVAVMAATIKNLNVSLAQHQRAIKALAPAVDKASIPESIAATVEKVLNDPAVKVVTGARGIVVPTEGSDSGSGSGSGSGEGEGAGEEGTAESKGSGAMSDEVLASRLQQVETLNLELVQREKQQVDAVSELNKVVKVLHEQKSRHATNLKIQTLMMVNMHHRLKRAASAHKLGADKDEVTAAYFGDAATAATPVVTPLSPHPMSPGSLAVLDACTKSSKALHHVATAGVHRLSTSPVRSRDGRTSLSPLAPDSVCKRRASSTGDPSAAPTIITVGGDENAPPGGAVTPKASKRSRSRRKHRFRFADAVKAAVAKAKESEGSPKVGKGAFDRLATGAVLVPAHESHGRLRKVYGQLLARFQTLTEEMENVKTVSKAAEEKASAAEASLATVQAEKQELARKNEELLARATAAESKLAAAEAAATTAATTAAAASKELEATIKTLESKLEAAVEQATAAEAASTMDAGRADELAERVMELEREAASVAGGAAAEEEASAEDRAALVEEKLQLEAQVAELSKAVEQLEEESVRVEMDTRAAMVQQLQERDTSIQALEAMKNSLMAQVRDLRHDLAEARRRGVAVTKPPPVTPKCKAGLLGLTKGDEVEESDEEEEAFPSSLGFARKSYEDVVVSPPAEEAVTIVSVSAAAESPRRSSMDDPLLNELRARLASRSGEPADGDDTARSPGAASEDEAPVAASHVDVDAAAGSEGEKPVSAADVEVHMTVDASEPAPPAAAAAAAVLEAEAATGDDDASTRAAAVPAVITLPTGATAATGWGFSLAAAATASAAARTPAPRRRWSRLTTQAPATTRPRVRGRAEGGAEGASASRLLSIGVATTPGRRASSVRDLFPSASRA